MDGPPTPAISPPLAALLTFVAAAGILVLEIAAGRLLAPYVGVSLQTYTGIIGVILAGIALGAWLGGRAADRYGPARLLGPTFVAGGWSAILAIPIVAIVGGSAATTGPAEIVLLASVGFVAPATILAAVGPIVVRASLVDVETGGSLVGRLSAIGTLGALVGTFGTGFILLGLLPTRTIVVVTGVVLIVLGLGLGLRSRLSRTSLALAAVASVVMALIGVATPSPCEVESMYYCISIMDDPAEPGGDRRILVLDDLWHAAVDLGDPTVLLFDYVRRFDDVTAAAIEARAGDVAVLHLGGGGFTFPRYLAATWPASRHTVLELDPAVLATAQDRLGFRPDERIAVVIGDARLSVGGVDDGSMDVVIGDAFGGLSVPWHLTTLEFLDEIRRVLRPDGLYVMNLIDGPPLGFARAELATLRAAFDHVALVAHPVAVAGEAGGNLILAASDAPFDASDIAARIAARGEADQAAVVTQAGAVAAFVGGAMVLTDDHAPVDQLLSQ
jgi:spermidine synthase